MKKLILLIIPSIMMISCSIEKEPVVETTTTTLPFITVYE